MFYVYILKSLKNNDIYVGYSIDLRERFKSHNKGQVLSTRYNRPWLLIFYEAYKDNSDTTRREKQLKNHRAKEDLKIQIKNSLEL